VAPPARMLAWAPFGQLESKMCCHDLSKRKHGLRGYRDLCNVSSVVVLRCVIEA